MVLNYMDAASESIIRAPPSHTIPLLGNTWAMLLRMMIIATAETVILRQEETILRVEDEEATKVTPGEDTTNVIVTCPNLMVEIAGGTMTIVMLHADVMSRLHEDAPAADPAVLPDDRPATMKHIKCLEKSILTSLGVNNTGYSNGLK